ncbi:MAG TPA: ABC transporter ATP-binding protein, partial [Deltaproteobacteria bacterium]|nr:ABC transporter ATP-binding protein [Deltaproteobacteria bacterium]
MIELQDLHKSFGTQKVLDGLDLQIPKGKITVIIGRSGEGKSVLLKTLIGLIAPDAGKVWVAGQDLFALSEQDQLTLRKKFGMLFQNAALFDSMNVYD